MMLAEGRWLDALRMNALVIATGLSFTILLLRESWREWRRNPYATFVLSPRMAWIICYGILGFWVLRNIRFWPFELLAPFSL